MIRNVWGSKKIAHVIFIISIIGLFSISAFAVDKALQNSKGEGKQNPDLITIDTMKIYGSLDKPAVLFQHDLHTDAVSKEGGDCTTCHQKSKDNADRISIKFMRTEDSGKQAVMDAYHENCINCHNRTASDGKESGPVACAECHNEKPQLTSSAQPAGMDNSLHYRHTEILQNECKTCHHQYDEKTEKLYYKKGTEGTCRYCHKESAEENRSSLRTAAHTSCVNCHLEKAKIDKDSSGPVKCSGCHDAGELKKIKKISPLPRMKRNQPDTALIRTGNKKLDKAAKNRMSFVPFDHKGHEAYNDTCRVCHHSEIKTCSECHTLEGKKEGGDITLEQAMHNLGTDQSCNGCHQSKKAESKCAGCHSMISVTNQKTETCGQCHIEKDMPLPVDDDSSKKIARDLLDSRQTSRPLYDMADIPENININRYSEKYEPARFPHRKVVNTLFEYTKESKLAGYFHMDKGTLCQGCHHNAPVSKRPTRCDNCHGKPFKANDIHKPGIIGAYHIQCMGCHDTMKVDKNGCTDCHKEKK